jgi:allophanate hydrolase
MIRSANLLRTDNSVSSGMQRLEQEGPDALDLASLGKAYAAGLDPATLLDGIYDRIEAAGAGPVWISLVPRDNAQALLAAAKARQEAGERLPLYGIPFAIKDNIDLSGVPTTAGCPDFAFEPDKTAFAVECLIAAGAIPIGKTNLDQFATGLVGTRSPYGIPSCVFDHRYVSGGSSSGSAIAVASGLVAFALGTDTAGSGRVPASFNNIVGLKPTKGLISTAGVVPACKTQDCISVFANTVGDALEVVRVAAGFNPEDSFSKAAPPRALLAKEWTQGFRFGVPSAEALSFFGDEAAAELFRQSVERLEAIGGTKVEINYAPFAQTAQLLYKGPWVAERLTAIQDFISTHPEAVHPVVREIILSGSSMTAVDTFEAQYKLAEYCRLAEQQWAKMDVMLLPTAGTIYTIEELLADPVTLNSNLGFYTNFVNLMDLCALAVPAGFRLNGLPFGVTLVGRAFEDGAVAALGDRLHRALEGATMGGSSRPLAQESAIRTSPDDGLISLAVVGAHLSGQPLNKQLTERGAILRKTTRTAEGYSLYALRGTVPPKPGLVRDGRGRGAIEVEVWDVPANRFGTFVAEIPGPLGIGTLVLEDGSSVKGFLCEAYALDGATDITGTGGWRNYLRGTSQ